MLEITAFRVQVPLCVDLGLQRTLIHLTFSHKDIIFRRVFGSSQLLNLEASVLLLHCRGLSILNLKYSDKLFVAAIDIPSACKYVLNLGKKVFDLIHFGLNVPAEPDDQPRAYCGKYHLLLYIFD